MEPYTLATVVVVVLAAVALFATARVGAAAIGVLPADSETGIGGTDGASGRTDDASERTDDASEGTDDERDISWLTPDDHERIRSHLEKDPFDRSPDDLLPSDDEGS
jgi:hypothetical protein